MRTNRKLTVENLERREVFTGMPGVECIDIYDAPTQINGSQGSGTLIGPSASLMESETLEDANDPNAGLISSPLGLSQRQGCHDARDRLMGMVGSGEVNFNQEWINSLHSMEEGESCGV